ncbi:hypothetical protein DL764_002739 [Monosporascus ibericus]|uniref:Uncharacterized protein n=1 Tax=Monosporascus ibericus TaxID=155417 RepID=A0A4Q4TMP7_9PEZI|nr:hypothetical protein DL764_002739 [Monosporascus ibericus]
MSHPTRPHRTVKEVPQPPKAGDAAAKLKRKLWDEIKDVSQMITDLLEQVEIAELTHHAAQDLMDLVDDLRRWIE